jgi:hypothetical protein
LHVGQRDADRHGCCGHVSEILDRTRASHVPARRLLSVVHEFAEEGDALLGCWYIDQYFELVLQFVAPNG